VPLCPTLDGPGILARSVADVVLVDSLIVSGRRPARPARGRASATTTLGVSSNLIDECDHAIGRVMSEALSVLERSGFAIREMHFPEFDLAYDWYGESGITAIECAAFVDANVPEILPVLEERVRSRLERARHATAVDYVNALEERFRLIRRSRHRFRGGVLFVTPTVPMTAPPIAEIDHFERYVALNRRATRMTSPVNVLQLSAITLPIGRDDNGIPVGLQVIGDKFADQQLLDVAATIEERLGGARALGAAPRLPAPAPWRRR
jgi:aspartyl-tRNA(Asn)/glutamyl-tRNA(Gln) amidotransferase subunit A